MSDDEIAVVSVGSEEIDFGMDDLALLAGDLGPGDVLDGIYRLGEILGEGAMGRIFEAQDLDLNRRVAIKVPLIDEAVDILIDEARALAALRHKRLPVVHAAGRHLGINYFVMERLVGVDLDEHILEVTEDGYALRLDEVVDTLICITDALNAIHQAGLAHRDIKPANVLLSKRGPVLIDFGLVAPASAEDAIQGGSPAYVAPEIIANTSERSLRHLSDIYSLGVLAYAMLTGEEPFDDDDLPTLLRLHIEAPVPDVRRLRPTAPPKLAELIKEMMAKKPAARPGAEEALWAMQSVARNLAVSKPPSRPLVAIASEDIALVGKLAGCLSDWAKHAKVRVCRSGESVLSLLAEQRVELMLVDVRLADMTGLELLMQLPGAEVDRPEVMVALTSAAAEEDFALLERFGVMSVVQRGDESGASLKSIVRNVLSPRPRDR